MRQVSQFTRKLEEEPGSGKNIQISTINSLLKGRQETNTICYSPRICLNKKHEKTDRSRIME